MHLISHIRNSDTIIYAVDADYRITELSRGYLFASRESGAEDFLKSWGAGANVLRAISADLREYYRGLFDAALEGRSAKHDYECPTPYRFRKFQLRILPIEVNRLILCEHSLVFDRNLTGVVEGWDKSIRNRYADESGRIHQCGHCRKAQVVAEPNRWDWVRELISRRRDEILYRLCPECEAHYFGSGA